MSDKRTKAQVESLILLLVAVGVFGATNAVTAIGRYRPKDVTSNQRFTVSNGTGNLFKKMEQKIKVEVYVTKGLPNLNAFVGDLADLLKQYKSLGGDKFDFEIIETKDEDSKKRAKDAGEGAPSGPLEEMPFNLYSKTDTTKSTTKGYLGMVFYYGDDKDTIPQLQPNHSEGLEFWISTKMQELREKGDKISHKIGVISGKDELKLSDTHLVPANQGKPSFQAIMGKIAKSSEIKEVDLKGGDSEIDDQLDGLIITQPTKEYTDKELRRIDQFVMKGKSLAVFASAVNTKQGDATMAVNLNTWGLEKLLAGYGMKLEKNVLLDYSSPVQVPVMTQTGMAGALPFPYMLHSVDHQAFEGDTRMLDISFPAFFRLQPLAFPMLSTITLDKAKQSGVRAVARTSDVALALTENIELTKYQPKQSDKPAWSQHIVGAVLEGDKIKSAFSGGDNQGVTTPAESVKPARVFLLASSQFLTNPFARAGAGQDMSQFGPQFAAMGGGGDKELEALSLPYTQYLQNTLFALKNTLMWLSGDTDLIAVSGKMVAEPSLSFGDRYKPKFGTTDDEIKKKLEEIRESHDARQKTIQWSLIFGVPLIFVLFGLLRWQLRTYGRSRVVLA